jgi:CBS domain containing-hemolysin-like protein
MSHIPSIWIWLGIVACITLSALFAGLNLAIFSLSQLRLQSRLMVETRMRRASLSYGKIPIKCSRP